MSLGCCGVNERATQLYSPSERKRKSKAEKIAQHIVQKLSTAPVQCAKELAERDFGGYHECDDPENT